MSDAHELSVTRYIAAPSAKVWHAMTERREDWWCPTPWYARFDKHAPRAGGACNMMFHGPDGEKEPQNGIYLAYGQGRRFATTDAVTEDMMPAGPFMIGVWAVASEGDGTRYTATARHLTEEACKQHKEMGFTEGWGGCADQLKTLCEGE